MSYALRSCVIFVSAMLCCIPVFVAAATMTFVSDTISTSEPAIGANHTIRFTTTTAIPAGGMITITPETGQFTIPSALTTTDVDFSIDSSEQSLASVAAGSTVGLTITAGASGSLVFEVPFLIAAQSQITVSIGTNAHVGGSGTHQISNPAATRSYGIHIVSANGVVLDDAKAMIAIIDPVTITSSVGTTPPPPPPPPPPPAAGGGGGGAAGGVVAPTVPDTQPKVCRRADLNCDGFVNLIDFSIEAFWYKKPNPPPRIDVNGDGMVTITDFSIMAYYWNT